MKPSLKAMYFGAVALAAVAAALATFPTASFAQTQSPAASTTTAVPEATVKALQEALNKQGIAVKTDGVLNEETRAAIRTYQTQHHLPVTGEPDNATLAKLAVRQSAAPGQTTTTGASPHMMSPQQMMQGGMMPGGMMNCPMMQGQAQSGAMQGQMQRGQMPAGSMQQGAMIANAQVMQGMMQMMQGMMQVMQAQMQPGQAPTAQ
ncbi:MAG: peptidoglycan-binding protein [Pseudorhodoplanes sp.]|nr:peptidoglycan-binding protein [Pseudorhodoplanes sp.]